MPDSSDELLRQIEAAFPDTPYPGTDDLLHPECMDDFGIQDFYGRTDWRTIPDHVIERCNASLCLFSPMAYRYYLPAYLSWVIRNFDSSDSFTVDSTIYSLSPGEGSLRQFVLSKYALLDADQRKAVLDFLMYIGKHGTRFVDGRGLQKAVDYWSSVP